jgi:CPA1 family monovalent cation:H+ antiporter
LINSAIFLLIGLTIELNALVDNGRPVLIGIVVILLARAIVVYPLRWAANKLFRPLPAEWSHVLFWGGLRGAVSIALVLSLPFALGSRQLMREMAFGYVLFALVIQALTMRLLLKRLRVSGRQHQREKYEMHRARMAIANAGVHAVEALHDANYLAGPYRLNLREYYLNILNDNADDLLSYLSIDPLLAQPDARYAQREIIRKQKETLMVLVRRGVISDEIAGELRQELDNQLSDADDPDWLPPSAAFWGTEDNRS